MKTLWLLSTLVLLELVNLTTSAQAAQTQLDNGSSSLNQGLSGDMVVADAREDFEDWLERNDRDRNDDDRRDRDDNDDDDDNDRDRDRQDEAREDWERRRDRGDWDDWDDRSSDRDRDDDDDDDDNDDDDDDWADRLGDRDYDPDRIRNGRNACVDPRDDHQGWRWILDEIGDGCQ